MNDYETLNHMNKETQNIEFKESWRDEYLKWICGFANAQGGTLYIGVDDNGKVCGLHDATKLMEDIPNKIVNSMGLVADVNLHEQDGRAYIGVIIDSSNVPISYKGKYYYRSGSTMQEMNGASLQQFILKKMGRSWDDITNERATLEDIDRKAIEYFLRKGIEAQRISESELNSSTEDVQNLCKCQVLLIMKRVMSPVCHQWNSLIDRKKYARWLRKTLEFR